MTPVLLNMLNGNKYRDAIEVKGSGCVEGLEVCASRRNISYTFLVRKIAHHCQSPGASKLQEIYHL